MAWGEALRGDNRESTESAPRGNPGRAGGSVFTLFCCFEVAVFAAMMILGSWLLDTLQPWAILGGNLVAALVMLGILFRDHRFSLHELRTSGE